MHQSRRRDRRPARRSGPVGVRYEDSARAFAVAGSDIVIVGYFSGRQKDFAALMDAAAEELTRRGARVVGRIVQRRGVSAGGARKMALPYSSRTLLSHGKVREVVVLCEQTSADAVVFLAPLTGRQRRVLSGILGRPAASLADVPTED